MKEVKELCGELNIPFQIIVFDMGVKVDTTGKKIVKLHADVNVKIDDEYFTVAHADFGIDNAFKNEFTNYEVFKKMIHSQLSSDLVEIIAERLPVIKAEGVENEK